MDFALGDLETRTLSEKGVDMTVRQLDGVTPLLDKDGEPVRITLLGPDSLKYRAMTREQLRARVAANSTGKPLTFEQEENEVLDVLAGCTVGWKGIFTTKGEPVPFTIEAARALYKAYPAIRDQVDVFMSTRRNFIKAS